MGKWADFRRIVKTYRNDGSPADIGLLKAEFGGVKTPPKVAQRLADAGLTSAFPELSLKTLRAQAAGTLGREYARMLDDQGYKPFHLSTDLRERAKRHLYMMRYIATHDFIHVVTGFDTSYAGEIGVLAATVEQGFAPGGAFQEHAARLYYPLMDYANRLAIAKNRVLGHHIGTLAHDLLTFRYEDHLDALVEDVRRQLGIPDPTSLGVHAALPAAGAV